MTTTHRRSRLIAAIGYGELAERLVGARPAPQTTEELGRHSRFSEQTYDPRASRLWPWTKRPSIRIQCPSFRFGSRSRAAGEPMPEAMVVATSTTDGRPSARMVLLRGIDHSGLVFYTDRESAKGRELRANPFAAALFHWFLPLHRQVRVIGAVEEVDDEQSDAYWRSRPPGARRSAVASHQSEVVVSRQVLEQRVADLAEAFPDGNGAAPSFLGGAGTESVLRASNFGKKELTVCTIRSATRLTPEIGGSSGYLPDNLAVSTGSRVGS